MFRTRTSVPSFMFTSPFVTATRSTEAALWEDGNPYPRPDKDVLIEIQNHILTWLGREGLIIAVTTATKETAYYLNHKKDLSSLAYLIGETNMPALTTKDYFSVFLQSLYGDTSDKTVTRLAALPFWLGTLFPHDVINYLVHATYTSVGYSGNDETSRTWESIHLELPFMWIILIANALIHTYVRPITETLPPMQG